MATAGSAMLYLLLGFLTGIYGMCSFAPRWWSAAYDRLWFLSLLFGIAAAIFVGRKVRSSLAFK
jgi:hypothetical protein